MSYSIFLFLNSFFHFFEIPLTQKKFGNFSNIDIKFQNCKIFKIKQFPKLNHFQN